MNRTTLITVLAIALVATIVITAGYALVTFNMTGNVGETGTVTYILDGETWTGTDIDWGTVQPGSTNTKPLNVNNQKNIPVTPQLVATVPAGWTITWTLNSTIIPVTTLSTGTLSLIVPSDATAGAFTISCSINP
jgi:hypothetical protein